MSQQTSQEHSQRPGPTLFGKWLLLFLAVGLFIVLILAVRPSFIKAAWAGFARIVHAKNTPPPTPLVEHSKLEIQNPPVLVPQQQTPPSAEAQAQSMWAEFEKSSWAAPLQDWSSLHPDIPCAAFRGDLLGSADRQWSQRCSTSREREAAHWSFYVFGLQEPLISRLEQFDVTTGALAEQTLVSVQSALQTRLTARYGPAEDRSRKYSVPAVPWPVHVHWQAADLEIQLDLTEFDPSRKEGRLRLQGRHRALLDALDDDQRLNKVGGVSNSLYQAGSPMNGQLADNLRSDFPDVAVMLTKYQPDPDPQTREADQQKMREAIQKQLQSQVKAAQAAGQTGPRAFIVAGQQTITNWKAEQFRDALTRVLTAAKNSSPDRQPVLLLASDYLAWRLPGVMTNDKSQAGHWGEWRTQLAALGVMYEESATSPDEEPWTYTGSLLQRVWTDYGQTDWGERAFVLLQDQGWDTGRQCAAGADQFRQVIQQSLLFLEKHSKSPYQLDVQLALAQAYETWWSLSQARTVQEGSEVDPQKYQEGAEAARKQSITRYEQLLQTAPQSDHAAYARRELPRLMLSIDTGQRRFYCTVWD